MAVVGRCTVSGVLGSAEVFAYGCGMQMDDIDNAADALVVAAAWATNHLTAAFRAIFSTEVQWRNVRWATFSTADGSVLDSADSPLALNGTAGTVTLPYECSACVSLRTAVAGSRGRGRFYLPPLATQNIGTNGVLSTTCVPILVAAFTNAFDILATAQHRPVVISRAVPSGALTPRTVTRFDIGNIMDAQRRRRNNQVEARTVTNINYS